MINVHQFIRDTDLFRKIEVDELLFVEYTCLQEETRFGIWSDSNYFSFITSGEKMWRTIDNDYLVKKDDVLFVKKGANLTHQYFSDQFCAIFFFIPDDFIKKFLFKHSDLISQERNEKEHDAVFQLEKDQYMESYLTSILSFFSMEKPPNTEILKLKFEELLLNIFTSPKYSALAEYFTSFTQESHFHLGRVMEENFAYNLKLDEYARLCNMSLSSFKASFKKHYNMTPAIWLRERKLKLAQQRLELTDLNVSQVALECGFEDPSHFIRTFRQKHDVTPLQYRQLVT